MSAASDLRAELANLVVHTEEGKADRIRALAEKVIVELEEARAALAKAWERGVCL